MNIDSFKKLYVHELKDLYNAENQLLKALPKMAQRASSDSLKHAFQEHLEETKGHVNRLQKIFDGLDYAPSGETCAAMEGLIKEGEEVMESVDDDELLDAALIAAAQRIEHYEMAGYGTARAYAEQLGEKEAARILQETLDEEGAANKKLNKLATSRINARAEA